MQEESQNETHRVPMIAVLAAGVLAVIGFWSLIEFETKLQAIGSWPKYVALAALYFLVQILVEGVLGAFWESKRLFGKIFSVAVVIAFYIAWLR